MSAKCTPDPTSPLALAQPLPLKKDKRRLRARPRQIVSKNRFDARYSAELTPEVIAFGVAMQKYLANKGKPVWTCGEILDVLLTLRYVNAERDFEICVHQFTTAICTFKRNKHRFPTWGETLTVAAVLGWRLRGQKAAG